MDKTRHCWAGSNGVVVVASDNALSSGEHSLQTPILLQLEGVCRYFNSSGSGTGAHCRADNEVRALHNVSLNIRRGEFVAIMGQSGSGKTTLMNILGCLDKPTRGNYRVSGHDVAQLPADALSALRLKIFGFVFQRYQLLANYSALDNVAMPGVYSHMSSEQRQGRALELLQQLDIAERAHRQPSELSGGQQQRVAIARALINGAEVILADEPTGALDSTSGEQVLALLQQLHRESGTTIVLITHDTDVAGHAQRVITMKDGEIRSDSGEGPSVNASLGARNTVPSTLIKGFPRIDLLSSLQLAVAALHHNLFRTLLTLLGIIIGVAAVITMMAIGDGGKQQVLDGISAMGTNLLQVRVGGRNIRPSGDIATLSMADAAIIGTLPGVEAVGPEREARSTFRHGAFDYTGRVRGVTPVYFSMKNWRLSQGDFLNAQDMQTYAPVMLLGATVAEALFPNDDRFTSNSPNAGSPIGQQVLMNNTPYEVIGVLKAKGASAGGRDMDDEVYIPISTAQLKFFGSAYLSSITIKVSDINLLPMLETQVTALLKERHGREDFRVRNTVSLVAAATETQDTLTVLYDRNPII